jgi:hypothetical protein
MILSFLNQALAYARESLSVLGRSWLQLTVLLLGATALIVVVATAYADFISQRVSDQLYGQAQSASDLVVFLALVATPLFLFLFAVGVVWAGAAAYVADGTVGGRTTSLARATGASVRKVPAAVGTGLAWGLLVFGAFVLAPLISAAGILALAATPLVRRTQWSARWPSLRLLVVAAFPFAVAVLCALRLVLALPAVWLDGLGPRAAVERSWNRVTGSTGVVAVVMILAAIVTFTVLTIMVAAGQRAGLGQGGIVLAQLAAQSLVGPLVIITMVVLYRGEQGAVQAPDTEDLAPLPGSGTRQVAVASAVAIALQLVVLVPSAGLTIAAPVAPASANAPCVVADVYPDSSGVFRGCGVDGGPAEVAANTEVTLSGAAGYNPDYSSDEGGPSGTLILKVDGIEKGREVFDGTSEYSRFEMQFTFAAGTYTVTAVYEPDANSSYDAGSRSITVVAQPESTTTVTAPTTTITFGNDVTIEAVVASASGTPTGVVRFTGVPGGPIDVAVVGGLAEVTTSQLQPGTTTISADYSVGSTDGDHRPSSGSTTVTVKKAQTTTELTTAPASPSDAGTNVTATVVVTAQGTPAVVAGLIVVKNTSVSGGPDIADGRLVGGSVSFDLALAPGQHTLQVTFIPDDGFFGGVTQWSHTVSKFVPTVSLTASSATSVVGESVTLTAQIPVSAGFVPTGIVDFYPVTGGDVGNKLVSGTLDANGDTTVTVPTMAVGAYEFFARYGGDDNFVEAESARIAHSVGLAPVAISTVVQTTDPVVGSPIYVSVTVGPEPPGTGTLGGQMTLTANGVNVARSQSVADQFTFTPTTAGPVELKATYSGDSKFAAKTDTSNITVGKRPVTVTMSTPTASLEVIYGDTVIIAGAVLSGILTAPTGTVLLSANGRSLGQTQVVSGGQFSFSTNLVHAGDSMELVASYLGDNNFELASNESKPVIIKVGKTSANPVTTTDATAPALGDTVAVNVDFDNIGAGATGTVTFLTPQNRVLGTATIVAGMASLDLTLTDLTTFVTAYYNGDNNFTPQDATLIRIDATRAASAVTIDDPGTIQYGDFTTLRARVAIPPQVQGGGTVTFYSAQNRVLAENVPVVNGVASIAVCGGDDAFMSAEQQVQFARTCPAGNVQLGIGTYELRATFFGNPSVTGSSTTRDVTVAIASSRVELVASSSNPPYGSVLRLVATVSSTTSNAAPTTGQIDFISGKDSNGSGIRLGSASLVNGVATLEVTADTRLHIDADRVVAIFYGEFRTFRASTGETPVALDRRDVELTTYVSPLDNDQQPAADGTSSVEVSIRSIDPGVPEPFSGTVTVSTADGATCSAKFDVGEKRTECQIQWKSVGLQTVTASYSGDPVHEPGVSAPFTHIVDRQSSASQIVRVPTSVVENTTFPITWTFNPLLTGTITVLGQPGCVDVPVSAGTCSARLDRTAVGAIDNLMRIQYSGDDNWLAHQFEFPIVVRGCYAVEVESSNPRAGSVSIEKPTNCATDTSTGYLRGTQVPVTAVANESFEFVRWQGNSRASDSARVFVAVTDQSEFFLATFQRSCYRVSVVPTRGELGPTDVFSAFGKIAIERASNLANGGSFDGSCDLLGGGVGFEIGTEMSVRASPEMNPAYDERDLFYGFGTAPTGAVRSALDGGSGTLDFVVDGPLAIPAVFGPRCRVVSTSVDPADETAAAVDIVTPLNCESPFGDGFRLGGDQPSVTLSFVNTDDELFLVGWTVNGELGRTVNGELLTVLIEPVVPIGDDDLNIVASVVRCQTVRVIVDGANSPDQLDGTDVTREEAAGTAGIVTEPNCPDGSNRYIVGVEVTVEAQHVDPDAVLTWSDNVAVALDTPTTGTIVVEADNEIVANFYLRSVCSLLVIDDPFDLVDVFGKTGCGPGYYLDSAKVYYRGLQSELAQTRADRSNYPDVESFERALASVARGFGTLLPLSVRTPPVGTYVGSIIGGRPGRPCFPVECRREPVTGDVFITVTKCQAIVSDIAIRVKGDTSGAVYGPDSIPETTLGFNRAYGVERQQLQPSIESTVVSPGIRKSDSNGNFIGYERTACESFDNVHRIGAELSIRAGVNLPGLYLDSWEGDESWAGGYKFAASPRYGFEYQMTTTAQASPAVQNVTANIVAICHTVALPPGVTLVESPPNCPGLAAGENSFIFGSVLRVRQEKYLGNPSSIGRYTQKAYGFTGGVIPDSVTYERPEADDPYFEPFYEALVSVDGDKIVTVDYHSENDGLESAVVVSAKLIAGVVIVGAPILFMTFVCVPCGVALGALAATTFVIDFIPGVDGKATGVLDLINPMSWAQCGAKWGANTPTVPNLPPLPPTEGPPPPPGTRSAGEALFLERSIELAEREPQFLIDLGRELNKLNLLPGGNLTVEQLRIFSKDPEFAVTLAKRADFFRKVAAASYAKSATGVTSIYKDLTKAKGALGKLMAVAAFAGELYNAGYFSSDLASNNEGYQDVSDLRGTSNFTDCLIDKYSPGISTLGLDTL